MVQQQVEIRMRKTVVYDRNVNAPEKIKVNQGGTSSSKTYTIMQILFVKLTEKKRICTVVGQDIPNLKKGALRDFQERVMVDNPWMEEFIESYNKTDRVYRFKNGSILEFTSYKDSQDAKNGKRDLLFINEANGVAWPIAQQLIMRTWEDVYVDYNPTTPFWAHEELMGRQNVRFIYSNYKDNPFVDPDTVAELQELKHKDVQLYRVYGLGKTGMVGEIVFPNVIYEERWPTWREWRRHGYGLDFGYSAHPSALAECGLVGTNQLWLRERFYLRRMKAADMDMAMRLGGIDRREGIQADNNMMMVDDLAAMGWRIEAAKKGPGSIEYGIQLMQQYELHIFNGSLNFAKEQRQYRYPVDKDGNLGRIPIDAFNHLWDAARYWSMRNLKPLRKIAGGGLRAEVA